MSVTVPPTVKIKDQVDVMAPIGALVEDEGRDFPAALAAFADLDAADTLQLLDNAPDPANAARLTTAQISAALNRARREIASKAAAIQAVLRSPQLGQPAVVPLGLGDRA